MWESLGLKESIKLLSNGRKNAKTVSSLPSVPKLPAILPKNADKEKVAWEVKALPHDWVPNTKPSLVINKLLKEKEGKHLKCIEDMRIKFKFVNIDFEKNMRAHSDMLKQHLGITKKEITKEFEKIEGLLYKDMAYMDPCTFDKIISRIDKGCNISLQKIGDLHLYFQDIENQRSEEFKLILKQTYQSLHEISFMVPHELQEFFENEILSINQITLSNFRSYGELNLHLKLKLDNDKRLWLQKFYIIKEDYTSKMKLKVGTQIKRSALSGIIDASGKYISVESLQIVTANTVKILIDFDVKVKILMSLVEDTIDKIFNGVYDDIQNTKIDFDKGLNSQYEENTLYGLVYDTFFDNLVIRRINAHTLRVKKIWEQLTGDIEHEVYKTIKLLNQALHLWDNHFERIFDLDEVFLVDLKLFIEKNASQEDVESNKINCLIDKLRTATTEPEMSGYMKELTGKFENIKNVIIKNTENENKYFKIYEDYANISLEILNMEMMSYVRTHQDYSDVDATLQRGRGSWMEIVPTKKPPIILEFYNQIKIMHNWAYGLRETIHTATTENANKWHNYTQKFIRKQSCHLERRKSLKFELYGPKMNRIYENIYNVRLAEIMQHKARFESHTAGVAEKIENLQKSNEAMEPMFSDVIKKCERDLERIFERTKSSKRSADINILLNELEFKKSTYIKELNSIYNTQQETIENEINDIKQSCLQYFKYIKMFHEGGNYSLDEAKLFKKDLGTLLKSLKKDVAPCVKAIEQNFAKFSSEIKLAGVDIIETIYQSSRELEAHETIKLIIRSVQSSIKQETYKLKFKSKLVENAYRQLTKMADAHIGAFEYLNEFKYNCGCVEKAFSELRSFLFQEQEFKLNMKLFKADEQQDCEERTLENTLIELISNIGSNFNMVLFENVPDGTDYMSNIINIIHTALSDIQLLAKTVYRYNKGFIHEDLFKSTLQEFMLDILATFLYYQIQCEEIWLVIAFDYMLLIHDILDFIQNYYEQDVQVYLNNKVEEFDQTCRTYTRDLQIQIDDMDQLYSNLHKKLKPLHGHPSNECLLYRLDAEMADLNTYALEAQDALNEMYKDRKHKITENTEEFEEELITIEQQLKENLDQYVATIVNDGVLISQIKDRLDYLKNIISKGNLLEENSDIFTNIVSELNKKMSKFQKSFKLSPENLMKLSTSLDMIESSQNLYSKAILPSSTNSTSESTYINLDEYIDAYKEMQEMCFRKLKQTQNIAEISATWNEQWKTDRTAVVDLYRVKYDSEKANESKHK